jgi:hypothetical protein
VDNISFGARLAARRRPGPLDGELMRLPLLLAWLQMHWITEPTKNVFDEVLASLKNAPAELPLYRRVVGGQPELISDHREPMSDGCGWAGFGPHHIPTDRDRALNNARWSDSLDDPDAICVIGADACLFFGVPDALAGMANAAYSAAHSAVKHSQKEKEAEPVAALCKVLSQTPVNELVVSGFPAFEKSRRGVKDAEFCKAICRIRDGLESEPAPTQALAKHYDVSGRHIQNCAAKGRAILSAESGKNSKATRKPVTWGGSFIP